MSSSKNTSLKTTPSRQSWGALHTAKEERIMTQLESRFDEMAIPFMRAETGVSPEIAYPLPSLCQAGMLITSGDQK